MDDAHAEKAPQQPPPPCLLCQYDFDSQERQPPTEAAVLEALRRTEQLLYHAAYRRNEIGWFYSGHSEFSLALTYVRNGIREMEHYAGE